MGGGGEQATNKFEPPEWTSGRFPTAMESLDQLVKTPYQQYQGLRVAPVNPWQHTAGQLAVDKALYSDPQTQAARGSLMNISQGGGANPLMGAMNPFVGASNPFLNDAYLDQNIANTAQDMAGAHAMGTAAQNDALAARAGAYGGSSHVLKQSNDAANLAKQVGNMSTAARSADLGRKGNLFAQDQDRNLQGFNADANRNAGIWQQDIGNILQASGMAPGFSQLDSQNIDDLMKYGTFFQQQTQRGLDDSYQTFQEARDHPFKMFDWYMSGLAKGSGQYGTNYQTQPGQSPFATAAGLGMTGLGLFGGL